MNKLTLILIATVLFSFTSRASTNISGQIRTNTTWDKAGSPYLLTDVVEVAPGVTLTVEPGVTIKLDLANNYKGGIDVYGKLVLNGTATDSIYIVAKNRTNTYYITFKESSFTGTQADTYKLDYCNFWNTGFMFDRNAQNLIVSGCTFKGDFPTFLFWSGAENTSLIVKDSEFYGGIRNNHNNHLLEYIEISNNKFEHYSNTGWAISIAAHVTNGIMIKDNLFNDNYVCVYVQSGTLTSVMNNIFTNNGTGIANITQGGGTNYHVEQNVFIKNKIAVDIRMISPKSMTMQYNSLYDNETAIKISHFSGTPAPVITIENNCLYDNKENLNWGPDYGFTIGANWWGTTDSLKIDSTIFDYEDDFKLGKVTYSPYLTSPDNSCVGHNPNMWATAITEVNSVVDNVTVYPNPFYGEVTFMTESGLPFQQIELYDLLGKRVVLVNDVQTKKVSINTHHLAEGVYLYKLTHADNSVSTGKLTK